MSIARSKRQIFGQRVDEHQRVVDVRADDRFFGARLREAQAALGGGLELAAEDSFWEETTEKGEHRILRFESATRPGARSVPTSRASLRLRRCRSHGPTLTSAFLTASTSALLRLVLLLQRRDHVRIGERRRVAERTTLGDVAQQAPHDLARPRLRQVGRKEDVVGLGDRADLFADERRAAPRASSRLCLKPSRSVTNAASAWPLSSCALPTTAASATAGCSTSADSTSIVPMRWPATLSTSSTRPRIQ